MDIVMFLTARLDEDEAAATAAPGDPWRGPELVTTITGFPRWRINMLLPQGNEPHRLADVVVADCFEATIATHVVRHDPARVLRDVAAKRRLLTQAAATRELATRELAPDIEAWFLLDMADSIERNLAAPYDQHPDFDPRWRLS